MFFPPPAPIVVTFDYLGGDEGSTTRSPGTTGLISPLPDGGDFAGHTFLGWWDTDGSAGGGAGSGWGTQITTSTPFTSNTTVYARWLGDGTAEGDDISLSPLGGVEIVVMDGSTRVINGSSVSVTYNTTHTLTITNRNSFNSIQAKYGTGTIPIATSGTTGVITLTAGGAPISTTAPGSYFVFITAGTSGGEYQTISFRIVVAGP